MKIYYSRSNDVDDSEMNVHIGTFIQNLPNDLRSNITLLKHDREEAYDSQKVSSADLVIVGLKDMSDESRVGKGCYSEVQSALRFNIPVLVFTKTNGNNPQVLFQNIKLDDVRLHNEGEDWKQYGYFHLYDSCSNDIYPSTVNDRCFVSYISSQFEIECAMRKLGLSSSTEAESKLTYDFDDIVSFDLGNKTIRLEIGLDWLFRTGEDGDGDREDLFEFLGLTDDDAINAFIWDAYGPSEDPDGWDDLTLWPEGNKNAMNIVVNALQKAVKAKVAQAATNKELFEEIIDDNTATTKVYHFGDQVPFIIDGELENYTIGDDWLYSDTRHNSVSDLMNNTFGYTTISSDLEKLLGSKDFFPCHLWEHDNAKQMNIIVNHLVALNQAKHNSSSTTNVVPEPVASEPFVVKFSNTPIINRSSDQSNFFFNDDSIEIPFTRTSFELVQDDEILPYNQSPKVTEYKSSCEPW